MTCIKGLVLLAFVWVSLTQVVCPLIDAVNVSNFLSVGFAAVAALFVVGVIACEHVREGSKSS